MILVTPVWHGTKDEADALLAVLARNCLCKWNDDGSLNDQCGVHRMLLTDQKALDGLLFAKRIAHRLIYEEESDAAGR